MAKVINYETRLQMYSAFPRDGVGVEIGVCRGQNAALLWMATRPKELHLVDIWQHNPNTMQHPIEAIYSDWEKDVKALMGDLPGVQTHRMMSVDFLAAQPDQSLDWVYLDADHTYEAAQEEIALSCKKVRQGGVIAGHDFCVHHYAPWRSGIIRAVLEAVVDGRLAFEAIAEETYASYMCRVL